MINRFYSWPIRVYLMIMVALLAVPSISLILYSGITERQEAIVGAKAECLKFVNNVAGLHQAMVAGAEQLVIALSLLPPVQSRNPAATNALLADLLRKNPQYTNIVLGDRFGLLWASGISLKEKLYLADRKHYQEAIRTGMFSSGEYSIGRATGKSVLMFGYPVKNASNELISVVGITFDLEYAQRMFEKLNFPSGSSFSLLDHQGIILTRNLKDPFSKKLVGRPDIKGENYTKMVEGPDEGTFESMGNDNKSRLVAYKKIRLPHESKPYLYIRSSIPLASATSKANAAMLKNLSVFVSLFIVGLFLAWFIGKRLIVNPVTMLKGASAQLAAGTETVRVSHKVMGGELGELARTFDGMAEALVQRENAKNLVEGALRESEQRWATTLASIGDAVIATDVEGKITFMNAMAEELTGWTTGEADKKPATAVFNIINEQTRNQVESPITKVLREGMVVGLANHTILVRKDGTEVPIDDSGAPIRDREGKTWGVVLVFHDITERKRAEQALKESENRLRRFYESGLLGVIYWNMNGEITDANDKFLEMVGYDREDLTAGRIDWGGMTPPEYRHLDENSVAELKATGMNKTPFEKEYIRKDGSRIPIIVAGAMLDEARFNGVAFVLDITERKQAEEAIRKSEEKYRHIIEYSPAAIYEIDFNAGRFKTVNEGACRMLGYTEAELLAMNPLDLFDEESREIFLDRIRHAQAGETPLDQIEYKGKRKDGTDIWGILHNKFEYADGKIVGAFVVAHDITERKRAEEALQQRTLELQHLTETLEERVKERTAELADLSSQLVSAQEDERRRVSYDLHDNAWQALVAIRFEMERLFSNRDGMDWAALQDRSKKVMAALLEAVGKIRSMQGDLWPYVLDDIGILATIDWYCREFEKNHPGLTIERQDGLAENEIPSSAKIVIYRILQETLSNVAKHSQASRVILRLLKKDHQMEFTVEDNGLGFDPEETMVKRSPWGGLGLLNIKARTELSGGLFGVESATGKGTVVRASWSLHGE